VRKANFGEQPAREILLADISRAAKTEKRNERVGAASRGNCKDFADGFVGWISCRAVQRGKSRFLATLDKTDVTIDAMTFGFVDCFC
jgi:hypothetical protein